MKKLILAAVMAAVSFGALAAQPSPVELQRVAFTNLPIIVKGGYTSNFVSNPLLLPKDTAVGIWLRFQADVNTNTPGAVLADVINTNTLVTNISVQFALMKSLATNDQTYHTIMGLNSTPTFGSCYQNATNWVLGFTNFSAETLAGALYLRPIAIKYPSSATNHCITNISLSATWVK